VSGVRRLGNRNQERGIRGQRLEVGGKKSEIRKEERGKRN
jgi:hypothetical protein